MSAKYIWEAMDEIENALKESGLWEFEEVRDAWAIIRTFYEDHLGVDIG